MEGYNGHRGWINLLAIHPDFREDGYEQKIIISVETEIREMGCPKISLQIRQGNDKLISSYQKICFTDDLAISMGKWLEADHS